MITVLAVGPSPDAWGNIAGPLLWIFFILILVGAIQERRK